MGALHRGHASLLQRARRHAGARGTVVVSIFVNPTQFGPNEDYSRYPRALTADRELCAAHGADLLFLPSADEMYGPDFSTWVTEEKMSASLCGASRPGHFRGVCTVVLKLLQITNPDAAVFGLKDFQQWVIVDRMARDLNLPVRIVPAQTVREPDGLALSSRNRYLSATERAQAPILFQALREAREAFRAGERSAARLRRKMIETIATAPAARVDYVEIAHARTLQRVETVERNCVIALAVFFGTTRLIDNCWIR